MTLPPPADVSYTLYKLTELDKAVLKAIDHGAKSGNQIVLAIGRRRQSVFHALRNLVSIGILNGQPYSGNVDYVGNPR